MKKLHLLCLLSIVWLSTVYGQETALVIKVNGVYGIINKGVNQGMVEGQEHYVRRATANGLVEVCKVKVIRTTANRAAVEQMTSRRESLLQEGDKLFSVRTFEQGFAPSSNEIVERPRMASNGERLERTERASSITEPMSNDARLPETVPETTSRDYATPSYSFIKPWLSINTGATFPSSSLSIGGSPSFILGGSYMISTGYFNFGVELNNTFFSSSSFGGNNSIGSSTVSSASLLEALFVMQKFLNYNFFIEGGGGVYRPKIQVVSADDVESSFSQANFGIFGGAGIFLPTSRYAGIMLKGRLHNFFDETSRQYFGLTGGFRFKVR